MNIMISIIALVCLWATSVPAAVYTGAMDTRATFPFVPGLTAQTRAFIHGGDFGGGVRLEWRVDNETTPGSWTYTYRLLRGVERNKGFAFFDFETAADFTAANILSRQVLAATDRFGAPAPSGLGAITISDPVNFNFVHNFSNPALTETSAGTVLNKSDLSHYSGDPGRAAPGVPGPPASLTPSVGPVPHPFYGMRVTFPGSFENLFYEVSEWEFNVVTDRVPMWGKVFAWGDQTIVTPFWYTNFYNDTIDSPDRLELAPVNSGTGAGPYQGWVLVPGSLPGVTATVPADTAAGVPVTEPVSAIFRGIMDGSTLTSGTFTVTSGGNPVSGAVSYNPASKTVTFQPDLPLVPNTTYTATIAASVKDLAGNLLGSPASWSFTTSVEDLTPPTVSALLPGAGSNYLPLATAFAATFSEAMDPATLIPANFSVAGVSGSVTYDAATRTATFTPTAPLANNTSYTATIGTGVKDLAGNSLATPLTWDVSTIPAETVFPLVVSNFPVRNAVNVVTTTPVKITFSEAIDPATITPATINITGVAGSVSYDAASFTATITPSAPLAFNTTFTVNAGTGIRDLAGNPLALPARFTFRTLSQTAITFSASGTITGPGGQPLPGVSLQVNLTSQSGTSQQIIQTDAAGHYTVAGLLNGTYLIVPSLAGTIMSPRSIATSVTTANVTGLNFVGSPFTLTATPASPQNAGTPVAFAADLVGATGTYEYQFWLKDTSGIYTLVQPFSASKIWSWITSGLPAGTYSVAAQVKLAGTTPVNGFEAEKVVNFVLTPQPVGTLDPTTIPKYVTPLVIPPQMPTSTASPAPAADYDIAVRQFKQQILPGGIWNTLNGRADNFGATTVWSYGRAQDPLPDSSGIGGAVGVAPAPNSTFNYPSFTVENSSSTPTSVRWINDLVDPVSGNYLPHLFPVDQTLHWANPPMANCAMDAPNRTDCETMIPEPYTGPVPLVTHVHGSHVQPDSDGYPEAWWLPGVPGTKGIPLSYGERGSVFTQANNTNTLPGSAYYSYQNDQPATTLWYHDHALGMTRLNVYAGPAGFWLVRGGANDLAAGILPGPAPSIAAGDPNFNAATRANIREIPLAIQDRSFNADGSLFYPASREFFDGFVGPYIGTMIPNEFSDISGIWNPEAFFNTMVVNGTTWPKLESAPARYRLRLLNGCNSRTINLAMFVVSDLGVDGLPGTADDVLGAEVPFYQIGGDQGFLPNVVKIQTGQVTTLPGNGTVPAATPTASPEQALLLGPAERADVIVDFSSMANGTRVRIINTAPDAPFGGFPDVAADPLTTGQVMDFIVNSTLTKPADATTALPQNLVLPAEGSLGTETNTRKVSLNELMSDQVCIELDPNGVIVGTLFTRPPADPTFMNDCLTAAPVTPGNTTDVMGPRQAQLGVMTVDPLTGSLLSQSLKWADPITEYPLLNSTEIWEMYNTTVDAHPIHLHLVRYEVINRQELDPLTLLPVPGTVTGPNPNELGYKDTVVAYPGQVTRIKARFDIPGLYVWHCHIVEHEDNEMMRPFIVAVPPTGLVVTPSLSSPRVAGTQITFSAAATDGNAASEFQFWLKDTSGNYSLVQPFSAAASWLWNTSGLPPGVYSVAAQARTPGSSPPNGFHAEAVTDFVLSPTTITTMDVTVSPAAPQLAGTPLTIAATNVSGGSGTYEYQFWLKDTSGTYTLSQAYSASNVRNLDTSGFIPGVYYMAVQVKSVGSISPNGYDLEKVVSFIIAPPPVTAMDIQTSAASPQPVGTPLTFTAINVSGGSGTYEYQFWLKDTANSYTLVQPYSAAAFWNWDTAGLPQGTYFVAVQARSVGSTAVNGFDQERVVPFNLGP